MELVSRPARLALIAVAVLAFLAISALLARVLSANTGERAAIVQLLDAEARGDARGLTALLSGCRAEPACRSSAQANAGRLRRAGRVQVLAYDPSTRFSIAGSRGVARVAWRVAPGLPVVQCVGVRREGDPISGLRVGLTALSAPIRGDASCPGR